MGCSAQGQDLPNGVWCAPCHWDQCPSSGVQHTTVGGVGGTTGLAWCLGEPKRKKPVRGGAPRLENFPVLPFIPLLKRNLVLVVKWNERICFHGNQKKPSPKWSSSIHSPLESILDQNVRGACYGICLSPQWTPDL